jgi:hypothetical protein
MALAGKMQFVSEETNVQYKRVLLRGVQGTFVQPTGIKFITSSFLIHIVVNCDITSQGRAPNWPHV